MTVIFPGVFADRKVHPNVSYFTNGQLGGDSMLDSHQDRAFHTKRRGSCSTDKTSNSTVLCIAPTRRPFRRHTYNKSKSTVKDPPYLVTTCCIFVLHLLTHSHSGKYGYILLYLFSMSRIFYLRCAASLSQGWSVQPLPRGLPGKLLLPSDGFTWMLSEPYLGRPCC